MARDIIPSNFSDFLTISEAADFLGVSTATLRNWDRSGKLKPRRHPHNGYRIYLHEDLEAVLRSAELPFDSDSLPPLVNAESPLSTGAEVKMFQLFWFCQNPPVVAALAPRTESKGSPTRSARSVMRRFRSNCRLSASWNVASR